MHEASRLYDGLPTSTVLCLLLLGTLSKSNQGIKKLTS